MKRWKKLLSLCLAAILTYTCAALVFAYEEEDAAAVAAEIEGLERLQEEAQKADESATEATDSAGDTSQNAGNTTASTGSGLEEGARSVLLMEADSGTILYAYNADDPMPPASITKVMTLLLVMEAIENGKIALTDEVEASEHAASMGGSQIWLEAGERMSLDDLLKATVIASANDAAVALAEHVAGTEDAFVTLMNERAAELGMTNTTFKNATGLDADGHLSTASDIAVMSRELLKHPKILEYSTVWMDTLRGGETELTNTNRLVRFYEGATGLKTGTTDGAGSCISATAERGDLSLIAVIMGSQNSKERNNVAWKLLDWGFANFDAYTPEPIDLEVTELPVKGGTASSVPIGYEIDGTVLIEKGSQDAIDYDVELVENLEAPVEMGKEVGRVRILLEGEELASYPITCRESVDSMTFCAAFELLLRCAVGGTEI